MTQFLNRFAAGGLLCLSAGVVLANHDGMKSQSGGDKWRKQTPVVIAQIEEAAQERLRAADQDGNGILSIEEFQTMKPRQSQARLGEDRRTRKHSGKKRQRHQKRGHRKMTKEARAEMQTKIAAITYQLLDSDQNGSVSETEYAAANHRQIRRAARSQVVFASLNKDRDGLLSPTEVPTAVKRLRAMDEDGDGTVTRKEMRAARRAASPS